MIAVTYADMAAATKNAAPKVRTSGLSLRMAWACAISGVAFVALSTLGHLWFAPFVAGVILGGVTRWRQARARAAVGLVVAAALVGWAVPLLWQAVAGRPVVGTAGVVAALAGLPASGWLIIAVTLLVGGGQGLIGVWTGRALVGLKHAPAAGADDQLAAPKVRASLARQSHR